MARKYKSRVTSDKLDIKIELQKEALEKAKAKYEAEKETLAELIKMRNELRKEELMNAVINSDKSYEEILAFVKGKDFIWTSNNTASGLENICIYSYPYEGPETFNKTYILHKRDSIMEKNLPGERPGMYMQTDTLCTTVRPIVVHGMYAMEARGLWVMKNDFMGGPFVSHSRVDVENNRVVVVEGFVYAPEKMKRGLIRRLEGSLYTLQLPEEQEILEIKPDIEEEQKSQNTEQVTKQE